MWSRIRDVLAGLSGRLELEMDLCRTCIYVKSSLTVLTGLKKSYLWCLSWTVWTHGIVNCLKFTLKILLTLKLDCLDVWNCKLCKVIVNCVNWTCRICDILAGLSGCSEMDLCCIRVKFSLTVLALDCCCIYVKSSLTVLTGLMKSYLWRFSSSVWTYGIVVVLVTFGIVVVQLVLMTTKKMCQVYHCLCVKLDLWSVRCV